MEAAAFMDLINSEHYDRLGNFEDRLENPAWVKAFLATWHLDGMLGSSAPPVAKLKDLRTLLRDLVDRLAMGEPPSTEHVERLNELIREVPVIPQLEQRSDGWGLRPETSKPCRDAIVSAIALSAATFLSESELTRVKICRNDRCRWVFYDESKNRSRRWCDTSCGNLHKVRRYRERQKALTP